MQIERIDVTSPRIPFKVAFRHSSAERSETSMLWVELKTAAGAVGCGESCPRPYVTGETVESAARFLAAHEASVRESVSDLSSLRAWIANHAEAIDANPAGWCALELALLDALAQEQGVSVEILLSLPRLAGRFRYTAVLGDMSSGAFAAMASQYAAMGFCDFKIKLSGDASRDGDKIAALQMLDLPHIRVRADANNLWTDAAEAIAHLDRLDYPFVAIEEPIAPNQYGDLARIGESLNAQIVLDESFLRIEQLDHLRAQPERWLLNVRVSKMGGLLRSLGIVDAARAAGIGVIVGAQVGETSLLTRAGLTVAHAATGNLVAQEGAFGTMLLERDVCEPPLMFGRGGILDIAKYPAAAAGPGFGLGVLSHV